MSYHVFILLIKWEKLQSGASWSGSVEFSWEICACDLPVRSEMVDMSTDSKPPWRRGQTRSVWKVKESPKDIGQPTSLRCCCMISSSSAVRSNLSLKRIYFQIVEVVLLLWKILECKPLMIIWHLLAFESQPALGYGSEDSVIIQWNGFRPNSDHCLPLYLTDLLRI